MSVGVKALGVTPCVLTLKSWTSLSLEWDKAAYTVVKIPWEAASHWLLLQFRVTLTRRLVDKNKA